MSFLSPKVTIPTARSDTEQLRRSDYREAEPIALACGWHPHGLKWITAPFGLKEKKVENSAPYAISSIAGIAALGPAHALGFLRVGGKPIALLNSTWNASGYADTTITAWRDGAPGQDSFVRVYRGSETQVADPELVARTGQDHPPYRGNCYAILFNVNWGAGNTSIDNVEIDVAILPPAIGPWSPWSVYMLEGVNPIAAWYYMATHARAGFSLGSAMSAAYWGQRALDLETDGVSGRTGTEVGIHPIYGSAKDGLAVMAEIASYFDGYFFIDGDQLRVSWFPGGALPTAGYTTLNEHDLVDVPRSSSPGRDAVPSSVVVVFRENSTFEPRGATAPVPRSLASKSDRTVLKVDRPFFAADTGGSSVHVPNKVAAALALEVSSPESTYQLAVRRAKAVRPDSSPLQPGDLVAFAYTPWALLRLCRVKELVDDRAKESVNLVLVRERGTFPAPFVTQTDPRVAPSDDVPAEIPASSICPAFLPAGFGAARQAVVLVERPTRDYSGAVIWIAPAGPGSWQAIAADQRSWAVRTTTSAAYTAGAASLTVATIAGLGVDMPALQSVNATEQADDTLLAYFPATGEWASVGTITPLGGGSYTLTLLRGRRGSAAAAGAGGANCWLVARRELEPILSAELALVYSAGVYDLATATKLIKVQPFSATQVGLAKPDAGVALVVPDITPALAGLGVGSTVQVGSDGSVSGALNVGWTAATSPWVTIGGWVEVWAKRTADATWELAVSADGAAAKARVDGVAPGVSYDVRIRVRNAIGEFGPYTATVAHVVGSDTTAPANPTGYTVTAPSISAPMTPRLFLGVRMYACRISWTANAEKDLSHYEIRIRGDSTPPGAGETPDATISRAQTEYLHYTLSLVGQWVWLRAVDFSGNKSGWVGGTNVNTYLAFPAGSLAVQDASDASVSAIKTGAAGAGSVRKVVARFPFENVINLTSNAPTETFTLDLTGRGFGAKPDTIAGGRCIGGSGVGLIEVTYDYDNAGNSSTTAYMKAYSRDGSNMPTGNQRFAGELIEFD